jgi:hypothetical protein
VSLMTLYMAVMKPHDLDFEKTDAMFILRVWDGMDGCWCDCFSAAVTADEALKKWDRSTLSGTKNVSFHEIDLLPHLSGRYPNDLRRFKWMGDVSMNCMMCSKRRIEKIQWSTTGIPRTFNQMLRQASYGGRKGRRASRLIKRYLSHERAFSIPFTDVPVIEYVTWNVTIPLVPEEIRDLFEDTVDF